MVESKFLQRITLLITTITQLINHKCVIASSLIHWFGCFCCSIPVLQSHLWNHLISIFVPVWFPPFSSDSFLHSYSEQQMNEKIFSRLFGKLLQYNVKYILQPNLHACQIVCKFSDQIKLVILHLAFEWMCVGVYRWESSWKHVSEFVFCLRTFTVAVLRSIEKYWVHGKILTVLTNEDCFNKQKFVEIQFS